MMELRKFEGKGWKRGKEGNGNLGVGRIREDETKGFEEKWVNKVEMRVMRVEMGGGDAVEYFLTKRGTHASI